ncbi:TIGR01548 family HAD-type hydrolase [Anabaena cylindrica FACHB-243]|uniref:HAD superfamily (Subfamily IA) hydrolase, TIGR01548 n=1 Tax=Anabaena cylindrica (strain ATCC 27899 / PCC 7122) TaxID=272123 RepID=K9ZAB6_ANACC|nr:MULTISPECIES: TIGR01548 family HAD-type hydrolase [Anabaena]AFZ56121.1 HAD superfamily (subfamily IA) hydrolase, TIGR01548 [Anabaena cylindrica PCC 7122]MBD2417352.1 TIGR01548 family HAD-type hydrolase [Anabaena cylindrica FACHB-243]MBY5282813.1 TIGR01548 family HAD-type hydrolase [Anabaena sp. CCAP 1446/1C]MBY5310768.1 TIGR01548 family HAD-type hydrolase [Anabaena sp. CCAP 1446/1C]MCM2404433.1 TIGR01548 family HAD-type hydrolase [Anabaena sp. CCAP 1446/1C]
MTQQTKAIVVFDIDGVIRDVGGSYRRALADTVEHFTNQAYRPTPEDIDNLKSEGIWNNDWEASQEFIYRHFATQGQNREQLQLDYQNIVAYFQTRYRGTDPENWNGYICNEPLLAQPSYFQELTQTGIGWGFFSGATRGSATYVLEKRLGLQSPILIAMEDAPGKPDPTGLFATISLLENGSDRKQTVVYVGDTVADMYTVEKARNIDDSRTWLAVGVLPPHVQETATRRDAYTETLIQAGANIVFSNVQELTYTQIQELQKV